MEFKEGMEFFLPSARHLGTFKISGVNQSKKLIEHKGIDIIVILYCSTKREITVDRANELINKGYWRLTN